MENPKSEIKTYQEFWPFYLSQHSRPETRRVHVFGTLLGITIGLFCIATGHVLWAGMGLVVAYALAWFSHFRIEKNRPATWKYPIWSFISDFRLIFLYLTRQL